VKRPHLISVDELRAAGALDVPPVWRKSLGGPLGGNIERDLFSDLLDDGEEKHAAGLDSPSTSGELEDGDG
jgi:hypothetical protein